MTYESRQEHERITRELREAAERHADDRPRFDSGPESDGRASLSTVPSQGVGEMDDLRAEVQGLHLALSTVERLLREERAKIERVGALAERWALDSSLTDRTRRTECCADARDDERVDVVLALRSAIKGEEEVPW